MKKLFLCALFATVFGGVASAHPITVTLSKGQTVILESTNYHSTAEVIAEVQRLEQEYNG